MNHNGGQKRTVHRISSMVRHCVADLILRPRSAPIFVLGHQKSGTTVIAKLLAHAINESYSHDMFFRRGWKDTDKLISGELELNDVINRGPSEFSRGVIKDPDLSFVIPEIVSEFPDSKIVFVIREPGHTFRSIYSRLGAPADANLSELRSNAVVKRSRLWQNVFRSYPPAITGSCPIELLATRWVLLSQLATEYQDRVITSRFEDFEEDKRSFIGNLVRKMGQQSSTPIDGLVDIQFQPRSDRTVTPDSFFGRLFRRIRGWFS